MKDWKRAAAVATAAATIAANMMTMPVFATTAPEWGTNGGQQTVVGTTYVVEPAIEVELPGDLTFGLNPMKLNVAEEGQTADKSQIVSGTYLVTNYSEVPVAVSAVTTVTASSSVDLKTTSLAAGDWETATKELKTVTGKKAALLAQLYPTAITNEGVMTVGTIPDTATAKTVPGDILTASAPSTTVYFVMDAFDEDSANKSMGGFKFGGALDPTAAFTEEDIKVDTVYEMNLLTEAQKTNNYVDYATNGGNTTTKYASTIKKKK